MTINDRVAQVLGWKWYTWKVVGTEFPAPKRFLGKDGYDKRHEGYILATGKEPVCESVVLHFDTDRNLLTQLLNYLKEFGCMYEMFLHELPVYDENGYEFEIAGRTLDLSMKEICEAFLSATEER